MSEESIRTSGPLHTLSRDGTSYTLLGTAHVSRASAEDVNALLATGAFDAVAVELCPARHQALVNPDVWGQTDLYQVFRQGRTTMMAASLALGAYQQRLAEQFNVRPGEEMRTAMEGALQRGLPVLLIDRDVGTTLRRVYRNVPWWQRLGIVGGLLGSVLSREQVSEQEIERLKEGDLLETTFAEFADRNTVLYQPLIAERDEYMAARLCEEAQDGGHRNVLAVIGAGHLKGIAAHLESGSACADPKAVVQRLEQRPPAARWPKLIPWLIVAIILAGFVIGFSRSPELGWAMVWDWLLINGVLSALGALIAAGHPVTVLTAFLAAPWTSLNPMIGAGMVAGAVELYFRKPRVADFNNLRHDVTHWRGWWKNRVSRTLLVFFLASFGSAIGTYVAGFLIYDRVIGA
ncbi:MAG: conjugal transfer protein TraB [Gammaproteobacteria bacterium HGW-Gammaproteobacteria-1]|jgi:pheromone shutdown-related protein TraB|nr:MAG: conjugal transfer protein TraB [Gammaproteobacteria bacterium HGW-Gammaproteobacteria-1]